MANLKDYKAFRAMSFRPRRVYSSLIQKQDEVPWGVVLCEEEASAGPFSDQRVDMYDSMCLALSAVLV